MTTDLTQRETEPWEDAMAFAREAAEEAGHVVVGFAVSRDIMAAVRLNAKVVRERRVLRKPASAPYSVNGYRVTEDAALPPRTVMAEYDE